MLTLANYQIISQIYESANSIVYRSIRNQDNQPVILKMLKQDYPTPAELTRYWQEYEITHGLDLAGVIKVYGIEKYQNTLVIIVEDFGGESLKQLTTARPLTVKEFLSLAIQIANSLGNIHAANLVHKDINPSNIIWEPVSKQVKIIDFGIASHLPRENPTLKNPEQLEGTLAYLSPEQTGRINRSIDYRTDLYSLGVTFYELLTGFVPFMTTDVMELVHCHIAKIPLSINEVNTHVPSIVSDIVMKLMAKNAEDRYQSAFGLKADLEKCLKNIEYSQSLEEFSFELAQNDFSGRFQIPQKLYGRESQVNTLLQAFERVSKGTIEMMLITGYSGVGKTALVHEVHKPMTSKRGYFAAGKFDQFHKSIPYSAITQAFNKFCHYLLTENAQTLAHWRTKILDAVGHNGQVIIDIIPDLELVIGTQPQVEPVGPTETQNRFQMFFLNFVKALCDEEHPIILFIDDLQWVDSASLALLKDIMLDGEIEYLLIIGAYRDNEVDSTHPFIMMVDELQTAKIIINTIELTNLQQIDINYLLQDSLKCNAFQAQSLTDLIYQKTQGNAFFTHQFLQNLYDNKLLQFNFEQHQWHWDVQQIVEQNITDNVVDLMANKINKLPEKTSKALQLAACIGNQFDLSKLVIIFEQNHQETLSVLYPVLAEGLIQSLDDNYKHLETATKIEFKFLHDRVQQAAYSLISEDKKKEIHLKIGQLMMAELSEAEKEEQLFDMIGHFNVAKDIISTNKEKLQLAHLNLSAGLKAKLSAAYSASLGYFATARELLNNNWKENHDLIFKLHLEEGETAYQAGDFKTADFLLETALQKADTKYKMAKVYFIMMARLAGEGKFQESVSASITALNLFGLDMPNIGEHEKIEATTQSELVFYQDYMKDKKIGDLENQPVMKNKEMIICTQIMAVAIDAIVIGAPEFTFLYSVKTVNLSIKYGLSEFVPAGYSYFGITTAMIFKDYNSAYEIIFLADKLNRTKFPNYNIKAVVGVPYGVLVKSVTHYKNLVKWFMKRHANYKDTGNITYAGYYTYTNSWFLIPLSLSQAFNVSAPYLNFLKEQNNTAMVYLYQLILSQIKCLQGKTTEKGGLDFDDFTEANFMNSYGSVPIWVALFNYTKLKVYTMLGMYDEALKISEEQLVWRACLFRFIPIFTAEVSLFMGILHCACYQRKDYPKNQDFIQILDECLFELKDLVAQSKINHESAYFILLAEKARIENRGEAAMDLYNKAIESAKTNEFNQDEALANELFAGFWLQKNMPRVATIYLTEARYLYEKWGATAKVKQLDDKYPELLKKSETQRTSEISIATTFSSSFTIFSTGTVSGFLDLSSILKASQTLSGEIVLSNLLKKLMQIMIENAGAERGLLILEKEKDKSEWVIEAEGRLNVDQVTILQSIPQERNLPTSIVNYVQRTREPVVLANAIQEGIYTQDSYIRQYQLKSILCNPILHQGQLIGILYLENNLTEGAFSSARLKVVDMLSSQTAISLENALLYRTLEEKVEKRTTQLATANQEITLLNERLKEENLRMGAELNIAKQLQQMVLPTEEELQQIEGLDIAGFMEPADEVGGDYYDVLEHNGQIKIGIGDVTGHGLESGVLMLMVQTAVRSLLVSEVNDPETFLNFLNRVVYDNVKRIKSEKNLTLSLLDYQDGHLCIVGQHEEVLVVRQGGQIERLDTSDLGFMVGVIPNIAHILSQMNIQLFNGDGIVLYTDGITEAQNLEEQQYGLERLCEIVSHHWHLTAQKIQQAIIEDVRQFISTQKVFDDITLLVLKKE